MREAMLAAPVGDDVYGEDPTVIELERRTAELLGHEAGLFCTSGSLANLLGVRLLVEPGQEVVCDVGAHIARAEMGAHAAVHGLTMRTVRSVNGLVDVDAYAAVVAPNAGPYLVSTAAVAVENTHNFGGGTIQPYDRLVALGELCRSRDWAITWTALGCGTRTSRPGYRCRLRQPVRHRQRLLLQGARGAGRVGAGQHRREHRPRQGLAQAARRRLAPGRHPRRRRLARAGPPRRPAGRGPRGGEAFAVGGGRAGPAGRRRAAVQTNIVVLDTGAVPAAQVAAAAKDEGVWVSALGPRMLRAVTHLGVSVDDARTAGEVVGSILAGS